MSQTQSDSIFKRHLEASMSRTVARPQMSRGAVQARRTLR